MGVNQNLPQQRNTNDLPIRLALLIIAVLAVSIATYLQVKTGDIIFTILLAILSATSGFGSVLFSPSSFNFNNFFPDLFTSIKKHKKSLLLIMTIMLLMPLTSLVTWRIITNTQIVNDIPQNQIDALPTGQYPLPPQAIHIKTDCLNKNIDFIVSTIDSITIFNKSEIILNLTFINISKNTVSQIKIDHMILMSLDENTSPHNFVPNRIPPPILLIAGSTIPQAFIFNLLDTTKNHLYLLILEISSDAGISSANNWNCIFNPQEVNIRGGD